MPVLPVVPSSSVPGLPFGIRRVPFYAVVTVALIAQLVWWFAPVRVASVAGAVLGLLAGWVLLAQFLFPRGVS